MDSMLDTVVPKSDQLNADDLLGRTLTIKVKEVRITKSEQPVSIYFEGDNGKPYKPCKSMRRVLIHVWKEDAKQYVGKSMTLYCDPAVTFGAAAVGGIRISHMSHIDAPVTMALTATKASRKPFTVKPLAVSVDKAAEGVDALIARINGATVDGLAAILEDPATVKQRAYLASKRPELAAKVDAAIAAFDTPDEGDGADNAFPGDREPGAEG